MGIVTLSEKTSLRLFYTAKCLSGGVLPIQPDKHELQTLTGPIIPLFNRISIWSYHDYSLLNNKRCINLLLNADIFLT